MFGRRPPGSPYFRAAGFAEMPTTPKHPELNGPVRVETRRVGVSARQGPGAVLLRPRTPARRLAHRLVSRRKCSFFPKELFCSVKFCSPERLGTFSPLKGVRDCSLRPPRPAGRRVLWPPRSASTAPAGRWLCPEQQARRLGPGAGEPAGPGPPPTLARTHPVSPKPIFFSPAACWPLIWLGIFCVLFSSDPFLAWWFCAAHMSEQRQAGSCLLGEGTVHAHPGCRSAGCGALAE